MLSYERANRPVPRFNAVRRVPTCYQYVLPLGVIKRHQCLVLGSARGVFTVAMTVEGDAALVNNLERFLGQRIFTVLVEPARMRMLIERLERFYIRRYEKQMVGRPCYLHSVQLTAIVQSLSRTSQSRWRGHYLYLREGPEQGKLKWSSRHRSECNEESFLEPIRDASSRSE